MEASVAKGARKQAGAVGRARRRRWLDFKKPIPVPYVIALGIAVWVIFFGLWELANAAGWASDLLLPTPQKVVAALYELFAHEKFLHDVLVSVYRILASFAAACAIAVPLGILMGSFHAVESFVNPLVSPWRYLPAPSLIPLLLMWLGSGEMQKLALLYLGVIWFLITLIMDHTKEVRTELLQTAETLGGSRRQILTSVVIPAVLPNVVVAMRQMLAVSWTYLVIAEIVAASDGIGAMMWHAKRFIHVDKIMAGILVIGILGLLFDWLFRTGHRLLFPYLEEGQR